MINIKNHTDLLKEDLDFSKVYFSNEFEINKLKEAVNLFIFDDYKSIQIIGESGVGKTYLIDNVCRQYSEINYFHGGYSKLNSNAPHESLCLIINQIVSRYLYDPNNVANVLIHEFRLKLDFWKKELCTINPELQDVFEIKHNPINNLEYDLTKINRLQLAIKAFFEFFTVHQNNKVIIHFDDLQWANSDSLEIIVFLIKSNINNLLFILSHEKNNLCNNFTKKCKDELSTIELNFIDEDRLTLILKNNLPSNESVYQDLVNYVYKYSKGSPYLITVVLTNLFKSNILVYSRSTNLWDWDLKHNKPVPPSNCLKEVENKISVLLPADLKILSAVSCFIESFSFGQILKTFNFKETEIDNTLKKLIKMNILSHFEKVSNKITYSGVLSFSRELERDFIYEKLNEGEKKKIHKKIASFYIYDNVNVIDDRDLFNAVFHLNKSAINVNSKTEMLTHAQLNLRCAIRALSVSAIAVAKSNFDHILKYKCHECWHVDYKMVADINILGYQVYRVNKDDSTANIFLNNCNVYLKPEDLKRFNYIKVVLCVEFGEMQKALNTAKILLKDLGVSVPNKANVLHIAKEYIHTKTILKKYKQSDILDLKTIENKDIILAIKTIKWLFRCAFYINPELLGVMSMKAIRLSLKHGINEGSYIGFMTYGIIIAAGTNNYDEALKLGDLAIKIAERFENHSCDVEFCKGIYEAYNSPIASCIPIYEKAMQIGHKSGEFYASTEPSTSVSVSYLLAGFDLDTVSEKTMACYEYCNKLHFKEVSNFHFIIWTQVEKLKGNCLLKNESDRVKEIINNTEYKFSISVYNFLELQRELFNMNLDKAFEISVSMKKESEQFTGFFIHNEFIFYRELANLMFAIDKTYGFKIKAKLKANATLKKMYKWQLSSPENHEHKYDLVKGLVDLLNDNYNSAIENILTACKKAENNNFTHITVLCWELLIFITTKQSESQSTIEYKSNLKKANLKWGRKN